MAVLSGCAREERVPKIVYVPIGDSSGYSPRPPEYKPEKTEPSNVPWGWVPPSRLEKKWKAIVVHHSDTSNGNASIFDAYHEQKGWAGVGYDFVIGNGTDSGNGEVEVTFRWREQRTGAHCKTPNNWANEEAVGICLVGDFNRRSPTRGQMRSLVKLITFLQKRYRIPTSRIYGHGDTPGARVTDCPGHRFPMARLKSMLSS
jgi:N-acetyl-anhydromuramyl-L-alanine amidase AmpD